MFYYYNLFINYILLNIFNIFNLFINIIFYKSIRKRLISFKIVSITNIYLISFLINQSC